MTLWSHFYVFFFFKKKKRFPDYVHLITDENRTGKKKKKNHNSNKQSTKPKGLAVRYIIELGRYTIMKRREKELDDGGNAISPFLVFFLLTFFNQFSIHSPLNDFDMLVT